MIFVYILGFLVIIAVIKYKRWEEKAVKVILLATGLYCLVKALMQFANKPRSIADGIMVVLTAAAYATIASVALTRIWLPKFTAGFANMIFGFNQKYKEPPVALDHCRGLIKNEKYDQATEELNALLEESPFHPEISALKAEILGELTGKKQECCSFLLDFFAKRDKNSPYDFDMLMLLDDLALDGYCDSSQVESLMKKEIKRPYSTADKKAIENRLQETGEK